MGATKMDNTSREGTVDGKSMGWPQLDSCKIWEGRMGRNVPRCYEHAS